MSSWSAATPPGPPRCCAKTPGRDWSAAQAVRGDWLLLVAPEMRFVSRWREALADHIAGSTRPALVLPPAESGWLAAFGRSQRAGLLIRKRDFGQPEGDLNRLRRRFGRGAVRLG